ncbi:hypothetical protein F4802DRAFT_600482 [Xylaria palmicola]|nr:hypothetical protein F4802DRAFT_600482 [Xylaria palmicola]
MQDNVNSSKESSLTSIAASNTECCGIIRSACERDVEAIVAVETASFPHIYADASDLAHCRRDELEEGYPYYNIIGSSSELVNQSEIHGFVRFESYFWFCREYHDARTGEKTALPANRPPDRNPANSLLLAATRADPVLLDDEFLFVSEICIHPDVRKRGKGMNLMRHIIDMANVLTVMIIVLVEGSVSDAAKQWMADEGEQVDIVELAALRAGEQRTTMQFYEDKLGFKKRAYFFWGRRGSDIPRIFHVMQYPARG